jgi:pilus assembly protein Flp/PilA
MVRFAQAVRNFINDEEGVAAIEYALLAALIAVAIIVGASALGTKINSVFNQIKDCLIKTTACTLT